MRMNTALNHSDELQDEPPRLPQVTRKGSALHISWQRKTTIALCLQPAFYHHIIKHSTFRCM